MNHYSPVVFVDIWANEQARTGCLAGWAIRTLLLLYSNLLRENADYEKYSQPLYS